MRSWLAWRLATHPSAAGAVDAAAVAAAAVVAVAAVAVVAAAMAVLATSAAAMVVLAADLPPSALTPVATTTMIKHHAVVVSICSISPVALLGFPMGMEANVRRLNEVTLSRVRLDSD